MKKILNYFKDLIRRFTFRPKACERYILNNRYREDGELIKFVQKRKIILGTYSIPIVIIWGDFPAEQYGKVELVWNNEVFESAKLMRSKHNLIYWEFNE